jgi:hypothetical protein
MDNVVQLRDFKRREEREAADVRLATRVGMAELIAESVCEMPPVQPSYKAHNAAILQRISGVPANVAMPDSYVGGDPNVYSSVEKDLGPVPPCGV